ncbi:MAG: hydroxyacylglutathione hydrolase [Alphaproteobacteria bacterium]|nr:hydroxyacylglutathione hydrolase [Alphaproteobacteria bacterium]
MPIEIRQFPCFQDNYGYLVRDVASGAVAAIDSPEPERINAELAAAGWKLTHIFNTHHHWDHAGGNLALKTKWGCEIVAPADEATIIPGVDHQVREGDVVRLGESSAVVVETPGHTVGHVVYRFADDGAAFVGDTLFALGCGRLFEGEPEQMWSSLSKLAALPNETVVYCAHEYTESNARFALSLGEENPALDARANEVFEKRRAGEWTVPTSIGVELETNPFLRADKQSMRGALKMRDAPAAAVFAEIRRRKDAF